MSFWLDLSSTSNKFRQSYFKGFVDISGGGLNIRSDASFNLFDLSNNSQPIFSIKSDSMYIYELSSNSIVDVSNNKLIHLKNVDSDIKTDLTNFTNKMAAYDSNNFDASINNNLFVGKDAYINGRLFPC